jgi:hypothetical protein
MDWLWLGGAALLGFFVGMFVRGRAPQNMPAPLLGRFNLNLAQDRDFALRTLRRELANYMVRRDPDRYLELYRRARGADMAISHITKASNEDRLEAITKKYPFYADFDFIGTREHVVYADGLSMYSLEDIEAHYLAMVEFQALQHVLDENWQRFPATSDEDLKHLEEYVRKVKDTKFKQRLDAAIREFFVYTDSKQLNRLDSTPPDSVWVYETNALAARYVDHFAESRYGFHFKDTDEFGLYGVFYADNRDEPYKSFYRSDANFEAEVYIDNLRIDEPI